MELHVCLDTIILRVSSVACNIMTTSLTAEQMLSCGFLCVIRGFITHQACADVKGLTLLNIG